jgi:hypothetical protein
MPENLPARPNIEQLKKQAKDLLRGFARKDPSVVDRFRRIRRYASLSEEDLFRSPVTLRDAQFAIALRYGFESWRRLSDHCVQQPKETGMNRTVLQEFNELALLPNRATQKLLREIDADDLARALTGADETTRAKFFANMSARAVAILAEEIRSLGDTDPEIADAARGTIMSAYRKLVEAGEISSVHAVHEDRPKRIDPVSTIREPRTRDLHPEELKTLFEEMASKAKTHGIFSLESDAELIDDPIIKRGLELVVDGTDPQIVESALRDMLENRIRSIQKKYDAVIGAVLSVQQGDDAAAVRQKMESWLQ